MIGVNLRKFSLAACLISMPYVSTETVARGAMVVSSFKGTTQSSSATLWPTEADPAGAVGLTDFAEFVNGGYTTFDKTTRSTTSQITDEQFWLNAGIASSTLKNGVSNPRISFDPNTQRWFATEITGDSVNNMILLAVSASASASPVPGYWTGLVIANNSSSNISNGGYNHVDFPAMGIDANALYITTINQNSSGEDNSASIFSIPKSSLVGAGGPKLTGAMMLYGTTGNADNLGFVLQPATNMGAVSPNSALYAVDDQSFGLINRTNVLNSSTSNASLSATSGISVADTQYPVMARQPDGSGGASANNGLEPLDDRIAATVYQVGNLIYLVHTIGLPTEPSATHSALRWTVLRVNGASTTVVQEGTIGDNNHDYFTPSICANANGEIVIAFDRSGPSAVDGDINAFVEVGTTGVNGTITFGVPQQVSNSGISSFGNGDGIIPWGLYSSLSVDPLNSNAFWAVQEVPSSNTVWTTEVTEVVVPEASTGIAMLIATCALVLRREYFCAPRTRLA